MGTADCTTCVYTMYQSMWVPTLVVSASGVATVMLPCFVRCLLYVRSSLSFKPYQHVLLFACALVTIHDLFYLQVMLMMG